MSNLTGQPFNPGVKKQVIARQKALAGGTESGGSLLPISNKDLQYSVTKTPFLRLASSINLTSKGSDNTTIENSVLNRLVKAGVPKNLIEGDQLAKNFILQAGTISVDDDLKFSGLNAGLNNGKSLFNGSYGWGGSQERGYVPMPGLTNAAINFYNNGALSKTTIQLRCYSKQQFQLLDVLYLRPGYTLLLEWGWSQYLDNDTGELVSVNDWLTNPMSLFLSGKKGGKQVDQFNMQQAIEEQRKNRSYNYDAVLGKVANFSWQFMPDGSYDCQITLTGLGDIVETLKANIAPAKIEDEVLIAGFQEAQAQYYPEEPPEEGAEPKQVPPLISNAVATLINLKMFETYQKCRNAVSDNLEAKIIGTLDFEVKDFRNEEGKEPLNLTIPNGLLYRTGVTGDSGEDINPQVYLKYGAFLAYIQSSVLLYNKETNVPQFVFDIDFKNLKNDKNYVFTMPGQLSADPRVCLIPYSNFNVTGDNGEAIGFEESAANSVLKTSGFEKTQYLGRIANMYLNINYIAQCLASISPNEDGAIPLLSFLKSLNVGLIQSTGGINKYDFHQSQDGLKILFREDIPQKLEDNDEPDQSLYTRFNVYGVKPGVEGSFIRNVNLTAQIPNNFSTLITIGAQSNSNQISANATSFSNYNAGLKDRVILKRESSADVKEQLDAASEGAISKNQQLLDIIRGKDSEGNQITLSLFKSIYQQTLWVGEDIEAFKSIYDTAASIALGILSDGTKKEKAQVQAPFFLPFNFQIDMDGISGIRLYEKFLMTNDILPPSYENDGVDLQVQGVDHTIDSNAWITSLNTLSVPANPLGASKRPPELASETEQQSSNRGGNNKAPFSDSEPPASDDPTSVTRFNAMQSAYNAVFGRDGSVSGMCAQWSYNLAVNYVSFLRGGQIKNPKLAAGGNANMNQQFYNNLKKLGYTETKSTGLTKTQLNQKLSSIQWGYGDVFTYYANDGDPNASHVKYGHAQVYVGSINSVGWTTSTSNNYGTSNVYGRRNSDNWNCHVFRAPGS